MVNIEELSAKELYELARKKEQEESRLAKMQQQLQQLKEERDQMVVKHKEELTKADRRIEELQAERKALVESQEKALALVDKRIRALNSEKEEAQEEQQAAEKRLEKEELPPPSNGLPEKAPSTAKPSSKGEVSDDIDTLKELLRKAMKGRSYISESLLREKLQSEGFKSANLSKHLDNLVKQAWLVRRSGGNYVLGKSSKRK